MHQARAGGHRRDRGGEVEHTGEGGRDVFADAVPGERRRVHTVGVDQRGECIFHREQRGLGVVGAGQVRSRPVEHLGAQVDTEFVEETLGAHVEVLGEHRLGLVQPAGHSGVLRALARKEEDHPGVRFGAVRTVDGLADEHIVVLGRFQHADGLLLVVDDGRHSDLARFVGAPG